ncbi:hypothetical protein [Pseudomonas sp. GD03944]|uniref:hypothetical protein n=1 Tax=Pseudomonas sp. GD03944 TaxID=2975409 RepID=UPI002447D2BF|nr:hypothetical protein [Pseudomonas sp. GD03944]MDH1261487.1 hypothetical protein [Pseudomonas sp. GD03944]
MSAPRYLALLLLVPLLTACEPETEPAKVVPEKTPPAAVEQKPVTEVEQPAPEVAKAEAPAKPAATVAPKAPAAAPKPPKVAAKAPPESAAEAPKTKLDLSLPKDLAEQLNAEDRGDAALVPLLPPLFEEKKPEQNPFQVSGKLLTNDVDKDYWDSVEGAELQFEFKR